MAGNGVVLGREKPGQAARLRDLRYTGYKRFLPQPIRAVAYRNRACDTLHLGMGYTGRDSETELASFKMCKKERSATVDCFRLGYVVSDAKQEESSHEALRRSHHFARMAQVRPPLASG